jgi:hypothetical protein
MYEESTTKRDLAIVLGTAVVVALVVATLIVTGVGRPAAVLATPTPVPTVTPPGGVTVQPTNTRSSSILVPQQPTLTPRPTATPVDTLTPTPVPVTLTATTAATPTTAPPTTAPDESE